MTQFLRDERIESLTITKDALEQINHAFSSRIASIPESISAESTLKKSLLTYVIRFDNKGYRVFSIEDLISHFVAAKNVERIIFTLESEEALKNGRQFGTAMELRLDCKDHGNCFVTASSDNSDWVDASFTTAVDTVKKFKNKNYLAQSAWSMLVIQVFGTLIGFFVSIWGATKISPSFKIENAFLISFLLVLFLYSNIWSLINARLISLVVLAFPNIKFIRQSKDDLHWLFQTIIGGIIVAITLYFLGAIFVYLGSVLGSFVTVGT
jgi:hypothetical protein